jgi:hypothetical protein
MPWVLAAVAIALGALGLVTGDAPLALLGAAGLAVVLVAFPGARLILGSRGEGDDDQS